MRLRFFQVAKLPPLEDIAVVFGQENILKRPCAVHFVVGTNGSGKSRLLRAIAEVFLLLCQQRIPNFPVRLAYDIGQEKGTRTIYFEHVGTSSDAVLVEFDKVLSDSEIGAYLNFDWKPFRGQSSGPLPPGTRNIFYGDSLPGSGSVSTGASSPTSSGYYPSTVLVYTSGATWGWDEVFTSVSPGSYTNESDFVDDSPLPFEDERPVGWSLELENQSLQASGAELLEHLGTEISGEGIARGPGVLVRAEELKFALLAVTLNQAIIDFGQTSTELQDSVRDQAMPRDPKRLRRPGLRGLLDEVDWKWPVTISLRFHVDAQRLTSRQLDNLRDLEALASAVVVDPGPGKDCTFHFDVRNKVPEASLPSSSSPADTVALRLQQLLSGRDANIKDIQASPPISPFDVFRQLTEWRERGLLQEVSISLCKRGLPDVLLYDWLSDGEQLFLSRMALFHLLEASNGSGIQDALYLLDEPETHFNDVWKREIVDIIDESMGKAYSQVVLTTHSSITLTDVFQGEIQLLQKNAVTGLTEANRITEPTFGADPSEIMIRIFQAPDSIGKRASEYLDKQIQRHWQPSERDELESLIRNVGQGYHRSELRLIWKRLRDEGIDNALITPTQGGPSNDESNIGRPESGEEAEGQGDIPVGANLLMSILENDLQSPGITTSVEVSNQLELFSVPGDDDASPA